MYGCEVFIHLINGVPLCREENRSWAQEHVWRQICSINISRDDWFGRLMKQLTAPRRPSLTQTCVISDPTLTPSDADVVEGGGGLQRSRLVSTLVLQNQHRWGGPDGAGRRPEDDLVEKRSCSSSSSSGYTCLSPSTNTTRLLECMNLHSISVCVCVHVSALVVRAAVLQQRSSFCSHCVLNVAPQSW